MKQNLRFIFMTLLCAVFSTAWGVDETITFSEQGYPNAQEITTVSGTDFTITFDKGSGSNAPKYYTSGTAIRAYAGNTFTVLSNNIIEKIEIEFGSSDGSNNITTDVGTYTDAGIWEGSAKSVKFTIQGASGNRRISAITVTYSSGSVKPTVATPTFLPVTDTSFSESLEVAISTNTDEANIYYTTNGDEPSTSSALYTAPFTITETTTIKAIAVKEGMNNSFVASATYTLITPIPGYDIDFESEEDLYTDWVFNNIESKQTGAITAHGGSNYGTTGGKASGSIETKVKIATPNYLTCYLSKTSGNTTSSTWYIQVSEDGSTWTDVESKSATEMEKGEWKEFTADLSNYSEVYVRVYYSGSTAVRAIDDLTLNTDAVATSVAKPVFTPAAGTYFGTQNVTISCETENATIYYTIDGTEPTNASTLYENPIEVATSTTIKAIAYLDNESSKVASATYDITPLLTIAQARNNENGSTVFTSGIVTSLSSSGGNTTAYIQDETAAICIYGADDDVKLVIADEVTVSGKLSTYRGLLEIVNPSCSVISHNIPVSPETKTILEINNDYSVDNALQGQLVRVENAIVTNIDGRSTTISQDGNTIIVRDITGVEYAINDVISLTANIGCYDAAQLVHPTQVEVIIPVTIGGTGYATLYYGTKNLVVPEGVTAYTYKADGDKISISKTYDEGNVIPASTGVVLKGDEGTYNFIVTSATGEGDEDSDLYGLDEAGTTPAPGEGSYFYYKLSLASSTADKSTVGFYFGAEGGGQFTLPAHRAYLAIPQGGNGVSAFVFDETVGISQIKNVASDDSIYTISGVKVSKNKLNKGIYIVNGKKMVIK